MHTAVKGEGGNLPPSLPLRARQRIRDDVTADASGGIHMTRPVDDRRLPGQPTQGRLVWRNHTRGALEDGPVQQERGDARNNPKSTRKQTCQLMRYNLTERCRPDDTYKLQTETKRHITEVTYSLVTCQ